MALAKVVGSLAFLGLLLYFAVNTADKRKTFFAMLAGYKEWDWAFLVVGFVIYLVAVLITFVRWRYLVHALGIEISMRDTLRIGFLGYLFNFLPTGIVGGDLLKAWMLGKEKPGTGNRAKALASVIVDRIVGLYVLFLVAAVGIFATGFFWKAPDEPWAHRICWIVLALTVISTVGIALVLIPGFLESRLVQIFTRIPKAGAAIKSLLDAVMIYRAQRGVLFWTSVMTIPVHVLLTISLFVLALGLRFGTVPFGDYFAIYPISGVAQTIPLNAGPAEAVINYFYTTAGGSQQQGLILAFAYRLITLLLAPVGAAYYFLGARGEVKEVMHDLEEDEDHPPPKGGSGSVSIST